MIRHSHCSIITLTFAGSLSFTAFVVGATGGREAREFNPKTFEVLGIRLGSSGIEDVERILGPAPEREAKDPEDSVRCYVSTGPDRTVVEFENWINDLIEFRIFQGSAEMVSRCTATNRIPDSLSTGNGLKLGMNRSQVIVLLGRPSKIRGDYFEYESSYLRPLTTKEAKRASELYPADSRPDAVEVYEKLEFRFRGSKVVLLDATHSETW